MYRYTKKSLAKDLFSIFLIVLLSGMSLAANNYYFAIFGGVVLMLLLKDFAKISRLELIVTPKGLFEKVGTKERMVFEWTYLLYITRTRKFNKFVMLADKNKYYYYLKPSIENRELLLKEIVAANLKNKTVRIDEQINKEFNLGLQLDDMGKIKKKIEV